MLDISTIATGLRCADPGLWIAKRQRDVSYPAEGNDLCFHVEDDSFWFRHRNDVIVQLVRAFSPGSTFFDIGGGNGCVAHALQKKGIDVVLVEPGASGVAHARQRGIRTVVQAPFEDAEFAPESLSAVGLFDVVEHIEDDVAFLRTIHRCLKPGGCAYVSVPAHPSLWSEDDVYAGHFRRYGLASLGATLSEAGFEIAYSTHLFSFLTPPIFLLRSLPSRLGLRMPASRDRLRREHATDNRLVRSVLRSLCACEMGRVKKLRRIALGSSCIVVAVKAG
jgi:SAM-dependent methyltransferase